jgi:GAF domain-containing protein
MRDAVIRRERRERERELEAIALVSSKLRGARTFDEMLSRLLDQTLALIEAQAGSIWLYDPINEVVELSIQRGGQDERFSPSYKIGQGIPGKVVQTGKLIVADEFVPVEQVNDESFREGLAGGGGACVPLHAEKHGAQCPLM